MSQFANYRDSFQNARLTRSQTGVLEVALHTKGDTLVFNGHTHEQFVELFHAAAHATQPLCAAARRSCEGCA